MKRYHPLKLHYAKDNSWHVFKSLRLVCALLSGVNNNNLDMLIISSEFLFRAFGIFYISSLLTFCLCGMCCIKWGKDRKETLKNATNTCGQHMTVWGGIWMFLLVLTPAAILFGTCYVILTTILVLFNCILLLVRRYVYSYAMLHVSERRLFIMTEP